MIQSTTPSGLRYAIKRTDGKAACCAISIKCGTRAEDELPEGTAHFVEHCLFKGTEKHSAAFINTCLDRLGGELNAYTTKEEIVIHATVLKEDIGKAVALLWEIATQATFPPHEVEIEKGVVMDEIISYQDSPSEDIYDKFESRFFEGHPLGRLTLGTLESIKGCTQEDLLTYYRRHFIPSNMALTIVADVDEKKLEKEILHLSDGNINAPKASTVPDSSTVKANIFSIREDKDNHEANLIIGSLAPCLYDDGERLCCVLLSNILGGPASNSLLNSSLREKHGWVYAAECNYTQYSDAGIVTLSIGCEPGNLVPCLKETSKILEKLKTAPLTPSSLHAAKKQLYGQLAISSDSKESQCLSMGKSLLAFDRVIPDEESVAKIEAISALDIQKLAQRLWQDGTFSQLIYI